MGMIALRPTSSRTLVLSAVAAALVLGVLVPSLAGAAEAPDPWETLVEVRRSLAETGAESADFVQVYVPTGFSSGERERGRLALSLPDCLRWDYLEPYPKSFLLCGARFHAWNPEDRRGQRSWVDRREQPGLDLMLLPVEELRKRYRATAQAAEGGRRVVIRLSPLRPTAELASATLTVDPAAERLVALAYEDREGNRTEFEITGHRALEEGTAFEPPGNIRWEGEELNERR